MLSSKSSSFPPEPADSEVPEALAIEVSISSKSGVESVESRDVFSTSLELTPSCNERIGELHTKLVFGDLPEETLHPGKLIAMLRQEEILEVAGEGPPMVFRMRDHNPPQRICCLGLPLFHILLQGRIW